MIMLRPYCTLLSFVAVMGFGCDSETSATSNSPDGSAAPDSGPSMDANTTPPPELGVASAVDIGPLAMPTTAFGRDGGVSAAVGSQILWTFGDTFLNTKAADGQNVRSGTAAWGTASDPLAIVDTLDAKGAPYELIPFTSEEAAANTADALNGWALWPGDAFSNAAGTEAVVLFQKIKRSNDPKTGASGYDAVGLGTAHLLAGKTSATRDANLLFNVPERMWGASGAAVYGGFVYLYACDHPSGFDFNCFVARVPSDQIPSKAAYTYFDGSNWTTDVTKASAVAHYGTGLSVVYNPYLRRFLSVGNQLLSNSIQLRTAPAPEGPWTDEGMITISDPKVILPEPVADGGKPGLNYGAKQHAALMSQDGKTLVIGYARPLGPFRGEIRLMRVVLK